MFWIRAKIVKKEKFSDFAICHENRLKNWHIVFSSSVKVELGYFYGIKLSCYEVVQYNYSERKGKFLQTIFA